MEAKFVYVTYSNGGTRAILFSDKYYDVRLKNNSVNDCEITLIEMSPSKIEGVMIMDKLSELEKSILNAITNSSKEATVNIPIKFTKY